MNEMSNSNATNENIWLDAINEASKGLVFKPIGPDDYLIGPGATIDSLDFLNFLIRLEGIAAKKFDKPKLIVEEKILEKILRDAHQMKDLLKILVEL